MAVARAALVLFRLAGRRIQHAQPAVAVGLERAHTELFGQGQGLPIVRVSLRHVRAVGSDGAELVQCQRLLATGLLLPGYIERVARVLPGLSSASPQATPLAEPYPVDRTTDTRAVIVADRLLQQRISFGETPLEHGDIARPATICGNMFRLSEARARAALWVNIRVACAGSPWVRHRRPSQVWAMIG